eukprot:6178693-Pleurochrysis_carterae.AAC.2
MAERDAIGATLGEVSSQFSSQMDALKGSGGSNQEQIDKGLKYSELQAQVGCRSSISRFCTRGATHVLREQDGGGVGLRGSVDPPKSVDRYSVATPRALLHPKKAARLLEAQTVCPPHVYVGSPRFLLHTPRAPSSLPLVPIFSSPPPRTIAQMRPAIMTNRAPLLRRSQARVARDVHLGRLAQADVAIERLLIQKTNDEAAAKAAMASAAEEE